MTESKIKTIVEELGVKLHNFTKCKTKIEEENENL